MVQEKKCYNTLEYIFNGKLKQPIDMFLKFLNFTKVILLRNFLPLEDLPVYNKEKKNKRWETLRRDIMSFRSHFFKHVNFHQSNENEKS